MHIKERVEALVLANVMLGQTVRSLRILLDTVEPPEVREAIAKIVEDAGAAAQKASEAIND